MLGNLSFPGTDNGNRIRSIEAIDKIFFRQQMGCWNHDSPDFVKGNQSIPVLIVAFEHHYDFIPLFDPEISKHISRLIAQFTHLFKSKLRSFPLFIAPDKRLFLWGFLCMDIHHIISKIIIFRIMEFKMIENSVFIKPLGTKSLIKFTHSPCPPVFPVV